MEGPFSSHHCVRWSFLFTPASFLFLVCLSGLVLFSAFSAWVDRTSGMEDVHFYNARLAFFLLLRPISLQDSVFTVREAVNSVQSMTLGFTKRGRSMEKNKKRQTKDQISDDTQISTQRKTCSFLFYVRRLLAFARSFNTFDCML